VVKTAILPEPHCYILTCDNWKFKNAANVDCKVLPYPIFMMLVYYCVYAKNIFLFHLCYH